MCPSYASMLRTAIQSTYVHPSSHYASQGLLVDISCLYTVKLNVHLESLIKAVHNLPPALMATLISNINFNNFIPIYHIFHILLIDISILWPLQFVNHVRRTREAHPTKTLIAGNVVTGEMVEELILSGADIVKVLHLYISYYNDKSFLHTLKEFIHLFYYPILHLTPTLFTPFL